MDGGASESEAARAIAKVTNDKLDEKLLMSDIGFFYADVFKLVKPGFGSNKGADAVCAVDPARIQPEVLSALVRVNAGYSTTGAGDEDLATRRFAVVPPASLQKKVLPWLKLALLNAFRISKDNRHLLSVSHLVHLLRELGRTLLQDVAFLSVVPAVVKATESSPLFNSPIFKSPEFIEFREEMRSALGEAPYAHMDSVCTSAMESTKARRERFPSGLVGRIKVPSALPSFCFPGPSLPSAHATHAADIHKRTRQVANMDTMYEGPRKRACEGPHSEAIARELASMCAENQRTKNQLKTLEQAMCQQKAEIQEWTESIEKAVQTAAYTASEDPSI
ncbi:hypothetical protein GGF46_004500 [Coemansia sp. RSA 552]|nr:hypothetical protein GGF46_004500 [Coemansia sp. RSA 552]